MTALAELIHEMRWPYSATPFIIKRANDLLPKDKEQRQNIIIKTIEKIKQEMEADKMHERVLEIQKNIENASSEKQTEMLGELLHMVSQIEQSLSDIKIDIDEIENQIETNEE